MKPNRQEAIYQKLYRAWLDEHKRKSLNKLPNKDCFLEDIRDLIHFIKTNIVSEKNSALQNIQEKTINNIRYMVSDLLDLREEKILTSTRALQKINESLLLKVEKQYYRQLFTAFKGYSKSKKMLVSGILTNGHLLPKDQKSPQKVRQDTKKPSTEDVSPPRTSTNTSKSKKSYPGEQSSNFLDSTLPPSTTSHETNESSQISRREKDTPDRTSSSSPQPSSSRSSSLSDSSSSKFPSSSKSEPSTKSSSSPSSSLSPSPASPSSSFTILRIIESLEPIVGADMKIYGPFSPGNVVFLPKINADILIEEDFAIPILN